MTDIHRIDLNLLRVFDLLMIEGSVSRAATRLCLSQSTVSHALSRLRRQFKDELFIPVHGGMAPTERAQSVAPIIRQAMLLLEQSVTQKPVFNPATSTRTFRIAGGDYIELMLIPTLMEYLSRHAPYIRIELEGLKASDYLRELESNELDLVIGFKNPQHLSSKLKHCNFLQEELVIASAQPLTDGSSWLTPEILKNLSFIYPSNWGHSQSLMDQWCKQQGIQRKIAITVPGFLALPPLMEKTGAVAALPCAAAKYYEEGMGFYWYRMSQTELNYHHQMAWHPLKDSDPGLQWFRQTILVKFSHR